MRYVVYGAGAVGGVVAARLAQAGRAVVAIARGPHLDAIRAGGLRFASPNESLTLSMPAVAGPAELEWTTDDVVLMCMKTQDTRNALAELRAAAGGDVPVICCQNGVANERMALRCFERVYAMVVMLPAAHLEPGAVTSQSKAATGILDAGRYPEGVDALIEEVTADLEAATFSARPDPRVMRFKYAKLLMNLGNSLQAACAPGREARDLYARARDEALRCFEASGIDWASDEEFRERRAAWIELAPVAGQTRGGGSSWQSLARGTGSIEADYLNGEIALLGRLQGIPTPVNRVLQQVANEMANSRGLPGSFPLDELRARIARAESG